MDLEFHQLDRRYEKIRRSSPETEKRLLGSLAQWGQQTPIIVVPAEVESRYVLVDGYKRVRALIRLHADTICATSWALTESDAMILERLMRSTASDSALEQGLLLRELHIRFNLSTEDLSRRFARSLSWVSGRLGLVADLPDEIQEMVLAGKIAAHAAMRSLVPLARIDRKACLALAHAIAPIRSSTRQIEALCTAFHSGSAKTRELLISNPALFLRAREEARRTDPIAEKPTTMTILLGELRLISAVALRVVRHIREDLIRSIADTDRDEVIRCFQQTKSDVHELFTMLEKELPHD